MKRLSFKVAIPELDKVPAEQRNAIVESFNTSAETAATRNSLGKLPFRLAAVIVILIDGVMVMSYHISMWPCILAGILCFLIVVPFGMLVQLVLMNRALRRYVQKCTMDEANRPGDSGTC